jgi:hypothetical protein
MVVAAGLLGGFWWVVVAVFFRWLAATYEIVKNNTGTNDPAP